MPDIPRYSPQVARTDKTGQVPIDTSSLTMPYEALSRTGAAIANIGDRTMDMSARQEEAAQRQAERIKQEEEKAIRAVETMRLEHGLESDVDSFISTLNGRLDYDKIESDTQSFLQKTFERYSGETDDPLVKRALEAKFYRTSTQASHTARAKKAQAITEVGEQQHVIKRDTAMKMWVAASPEERPLIEKQYELEVRSLADANVFSMGKAETYIQSFGSDVTEKAARAEEAAFETALAEYPRWALVEAQDPQQYSLVDVKIRAGYVRRAKAAVEALDKDEIREKKEGEKAVKDKVKADQETTGQGFVELLYAKKLTRVKIIASNLDATGENSKQYWMAQLDKRDRELEQDARETKSETRGRKEDTRREQDENEGMILIGDDFRTRDLKKDLATGEIRPAQYKSLLAAQAKLDPVKRDSVARALAKVETGTALKVALGKPDEAETAIWKQKYGNLITAFAYKYADDPNFNAKLEEFVEKSVLSDMVKGFFSRDATDRQAKYEAARKISGDLPAKGEPKTSQGQQNRTALSPEEEAKFQTWYKGWAKKADIDPNPDDPRQKYDYRGAYKAGFSPTISKEDGRYHWPSEFKDDDHPNRFVKGHDTKLESKPKTITYTKQDLEFTAKKHNITVDEVKKRMGIK